MYHDEISLRKMVLKEKELKKVQSLVVIIFIFFVGSSNCIVYFIRKYVSFSFDLKEKKYVDKEEMLRSLALESLMLNSIFL